MGVNRVIDPWNLAIRQNRVNFPDPIRRYHRRNTSKTVGHRAKDGQASQGGDRPPVSRWLGDVIMRRLMRSSLGLAVCVGVTTTGLTGCQTNIAGMTLPSGYYLQHRPQYFPPDPDFPLQRELATQQSQYAAAADAANAARLPTPVAPAR